MSNDNNYFVGAPVEAVKPAALGTKQGMLQVTGGKQDPAPEPNSYFVGHPIENKQPAPPPSQQQPQLPKKSFLAKCVPCLFGGGASAEQ